MKGRKARNVRREGKKAGGREGRKVRGRESS